MKIFRLFSGLFFVIILPVSVVGAPSTKPHILFIVADDLGWNDVGFHNPTMITPNIDSLANNGVIFNQAYVQPVCSPSRAAFLTGMYPFKIGLQHATIGTTQPACVPLNQTFLPQEMKKLGYATHAVGKWHLGYCKWECTSTYRGFDTFFGYYNGAEDYYTHIVGKYLDLRNDSLPAKHFSGEYSAYAFSKRTEDIIRTHDKSQPLFLYLPFQNVHAPTEVPKRYEDMYPHVVNKGRRVFCGMVSALDEAVGNITNALKKYDLFDNTLILFSTDNGGAIKHYGNNYPLRGGKHTLWEGGTRGTSFMYGVGLNKTGITYDGMIHAVDWKPTLISAAGGTPPGDIDGIDHWEEIRNNRSSKRTGLIYNLDNFEIPENGHAGIRVGDFKLLEGYPGKIDGWYKPFNHTKDTHINKTTYHPGDKPVWLFNVQDDPTERNDLSKKMPDVVVKLQAQIQEYRKEMVPANYPKPDHKAADPKRFGNVWSPGWC